MPLKPSFQRLVASSSAPFLTAKSSKGPALFTGLGPATYNGRMSSESDSVATGLDQKGPIVVYGSTGYPGKLIASELERAGADFVLAGRNREKLDQVAAGLGRDVEVQAVSLDDQAGLHSLLEGCSAVIACAGPFHLHGEPVMRAAVETGTHYLDTTGEQPYMRLAWERYDRPASEAGVAVIPAMGFDYVPGDMIASLTADGMGDLDTLRLGYRAKMQPTRGTMLSALEMIKGGDVEWRDGHFEPASQTASRGTFDFGPPLGELKMTRYPAGEHVTVPRHVNTRRIETMLSADSFAPGAASHLMPAIFRGASLAMRTPLRALTAKLIPTLPEGGERRGQGRVKLCDRVRSGRRNLRQPGRDIRKGCLRPDRCLDRQRSTDRRLRGHRGERSACALAGVRAEKLPPGLRSLLVGVAGHAARLSPAQGRQRRFRKRKIRSGSAIDSRWTGCQASVAVAVSSTALDSTSRNDPAIAW